MDKIDMFFMSFIVMAAIVGAVLSGPRPVTEPTPIVAECPPDDFSDYCLCVDDCLEEKK